MRQPWDFSPFSTTFTPRKRNILFAMKRNILSLFLLLMLWVSATGTISAQQRNKRVVPGNERMDSICTRLKDKRGFFNTRRGEVAAGAKSSKTIRRVVTKSRTLLYFFTSIFDGQSDLWHQYRFWPDGTIPYRRQLPETTSI